MQQVALKIKLFAGQADEYKRYNDEFWPQIAELLKNTGISDYSICLDEEINILFANSKVENLPHP